MAAPSGSLKLLDKSVVMPDGALRVLLSTENTDLKLPRALDFVVEPHVLEGSSAPFLLGYPTLMGTGLLKVILGLEQFESALLGVQETVAQARLKLQPSVPLEVTESTQDEESVDSNAGFFDQDNA